MSRRCCNGRGLAQPGSAKQFAFRGSREQRCSGDEDGTRSSFVERSKRRQLRGEVFMTLRAVVGGILGLLGVICAVIGIFVLDGISIEFPGIILGALGYYFGLTSQDRASQILGIEIGRAHV